MNQFIYDRRTYNSKKELKEATGLNSRKINAKLRDSEIQIIKNTGVEPDETNKTTL